MALQVPTKAFPQPTLDTAMLFEPTNPSSPCPIAAIDIMKLNFVMEISGIG